jgi:hypothetical protein
MTAEGTVGAPTCLVSKRKEIAELDANMLKQKTALPDYYFYNGNILYIMF